MHNITAFNELLAGLTQLLDGTVEGDEGHVVEPADLLTEVLERSGYRGQLAASEDPQDHSRLENLEQLVTVLRENTELLLAGGGAVGPDAVPAGAPAEGTAAAALVVGPVTAREMLSGVLEQLSLVADADSVPNSEDGVVTLMTLHTAKGLEFPVVFLTGMEDGIFPHSRAMSDDKELAEERRLAYVGITRAQKRLYVSRAVSRSSWGQPASNPASRFLEDIPADLLEWRRLVDSTPFVDRPDTFARFGGFSRSFDDGWQPRSSSRSAPVAASRFSAPRPARPPLVLAVGDRVNHDKYGLGKVTQVSGQGIRATAVIDFGASGTIRLMLIGGVPMTKL